MDTYEKKSFQLHETHYKKVYSDPVSVLNKVYNWQNTAPNEYFVHWLSWRLTDGLIKENETCLTVGDGYGVDAAYLASKLVDVTASDISKTMLDEAFNQGYVNKFSIENVEQLSFVDKDFDYVYCKESYHHFPRPFLGLYEMVRVCRKAVVIQEPVDILLTMPVLLFLKNILDRIHPKLIKLLWKNQYSFEVVGNFVYKVSEREFEKAAIAIGLPAIAFKGYNHYKNKSANSKLSSIKIMLFIRNLLSKLGILPYEQLSTILFKQKPTSKTIQDLRLNGYKYIEFPMNPYNE